MGLNATLIYLLRMFIEALKHERTISVKDNGSMELTLEVPQYMLTKLEMRSLPEHQQEL